MTIKRRRNHLSVPIGFLLLGLSSLANVYTGRVVESIFPSTTVNPDLIFLFTPHLPAMKYLADVIMAYVFFYSLWKLKNDREQLSKYLYALTIGLFARSIMIVLTPIGQPSIIHNNYGVFSFMEPTGTFPSGHTISVIIAYFSLRRKATAFAKGALFTMILMEIVTLILSHTHYSIDIVGGLMVGYISYRLILDYLNFSSKKPAKIAG